jgi:hypothetical protein
MARIGASGTGGANSTGEIDGGFANSVYLVTQIVDGGSATGPMANRIELRSDTASNWTTANPTLAQGEPGFEVDTLKLKIGNAITPWTSLAYTPVGYVTSITATSPLFSSGGVNPNLTIQVANSTENGYLSSTDWNTFNNKQNAITFPLSISSGGTGQVTASAAYNALSPMTTAGDIEYEISANTAARLPIGSAGQVLTVVSGVPAWASVASTPGFDAQWFGTGTDGNVTVSAGTTTLARDMFYNNLTISGTGSIKPNGYRIFVAGTLDLSSAPADAITVAGGIGSVGGNGGTVGPVNGGSVGTRSYTTAEALGVASGGGSGGTGNLDNGGAGGGSVGNGNSNGGNSGGGGNAGAGSVGTAGAGGGTSNIVAYLINRPEIQMLMGTTLYGGGISGAGGGGGGGDNSTHYGSGGGGGGAAGGIIWLSANTINRGGSTATAAIDLSGGTGGSGGVGSTSASGGGGGASGGGGGWLYMIYGTLTGSTATNMINLAGGAGGSGGNSGSGGNGGNGGSSASSGRATIIDLSTGGITTVAPSVGTTGSTASGATGGAGASINSSYVSL